MNEKLQAELMPLLQELDSVAGINILLTMQKIAEVSDLHQDREMSIAWRQELFMAAHRAGNGEYELASFDGILARYDQDPGDPELLEWILWHYKWIAEHVAEFPQASRERIDLLFADMSRRYEAEGIGLRPVFEYRCRAAAFMGHLSAAAEDYERWENSETGDSDDCPACEADSQVAYRLANGDMDGALKAADGLLRGVQRCADAPATTFSTLLLPLVDDGKLALAARLHKEVFRKVMKQESMIAYLPHHLAYAAVTGDNAKAKTIISKLSKGLESRNGWRRFLWFRAASVAAARLSADGVTSLKIALQEPDSPAPDADGKIDLCELSNWLWKQAGDLVDQFNRRNGTTRFSDFLAAGERWKTLVPVEK
jgi:two-component system response regulator LytT